MDKARFYKRILLRVLFLLLLVGCASPSTVLPTTPTAPIPTATATAIFTSTPKPSYTLQRPDFEQLLALVSQIRLQASQRHAGNDDWGAEVARASLYSLDGLITGDLHHYYANDLPNATRYIGNIPSAWSDSDVFRSLPSKSLIEILFNHSLPAYLNEHPIHFTKGGTQTFGKFSVKSNLLSEKISQSGEAD